MDGKMWFGTEQYSQWIDAPLSGANVGRENGSDSGLLLGGGGYVNQQLGGHKLYQFSWSGASALEAANLMEAYASGIYGNGLLYATDPMAYHTNVLPLHWSAPFLAANGEAPPHRRYDRMDPILGGATTVGRNRLPVRSVHYNIDESVAAGFPGIRDSLYVPIPPGMGMRIGAFYSTLDDVTNVGVYWGVATPTGVENIARLTPVDIGEPDITLPNRATAGASGVRIWVGRTSGSGTIYWRGTHARLYPANASNDPTTPWRTVGEYVPNGPWQLGQGTTGLRPVGLPTKTYNSGVNGGQNGYSITLREVGAWEL